VSPIAIAGIVRSGVFGGSLAGLFLGGRLPSEHPQDDSKDIVKLGIGVVATMAALVLGLLVSAAKGSFDKSDDEVTLAAARIVQVDRTLAQYGVEAKEVRGGPRRYVQDAVDALSSGDRFRLMQLRTSAAKNRAESVEVAIRALVPRSNAQRELSSQALVLMQDVSAFHLGD